MRALDQTWKLRSWSLSSRIYKMETEPNFEDYRES